MSDGTNRDAKTEIEQLIHSWAAAVRKKDIEAIVRDHAADFVMFDVPLPLAVRGARCLQGHLAAVLRELA
jgi:ketosteroid isomerase-like protein